jgi:hypothetical protein
VQSNRQARKIYENYDFKEYQTLAFDLWLNLNEEKTRARPCASPAEELLKDFNSPPALGGSAASPKSLQNWNRS